MSKVQKIFKAYGNEYLARYGNRMPGIHKKVIRAITECRSGSYGSVMFRCDGCGSTHTISCSCGNRHCPSCQNEKAIRWLEVQVQKQLPTNHFLLTLTLPEGLRSVARHNQRMVYAAMFSCAYSALKKLAKDKRFLGTSRIGFMAALHTWGSQLQYHPHLHLIIPAGAMDEDKKQWLCSRQDIFVHTKPLAVIFKAKFRDAMKDNGLFNKIPANVWKKEWVVDSQAVGNGNTTLRYLARYVFRVAISNNRIIRYDNHEVCFRCKDSKNRKWRTMTLDAMEFIRRFLQHVLPSGFMKIRRFGFMNSSFSIPVDEICKLIDMLYDVIQKMLPKQEPEKTFRPRCKSCGNKLRFLKYLSPVREASG